jgi:hypothetical protein
VKKIKSARRLFWRGGIAASLAATAGLAVALGASGSASAGVVTQVILQAARATTG